jgi:hypothetical protein
MDLAQASEPAAATASEPGLSLFERAVAIFVRPAAAWSGLRERAQWWFPLLIVLFVTLLGTGLLYSRAILPDMLGGMEEKVANGEMTAEQLQRIEEFYRGPAGLGFTLGTGAVAMPLVTFFIALLVWFAVGFILGSPLRYRHALEVTAWSSLVTLPPALLSYVMAWIQQSMRAVHTGLGVLLPEAASGDRMLRALSVFLDWIGPFGIWHVAVAVLGATWFSGAPRRSVAWALGVLYLVSGLCAAGLAALIPAGG